MTAPICTCARRRPHTDVWEAARHARAARRAADPQVQARARRHAEKAARDAAKGNGEAA